MAIAIKIKKFKSPRSIDDLKNLSEGLGEGKDETKEEEKGKREPSDADSFEPDGNEESNPQPKNTKIDDYDDIDKQMRMSDIKADPCGMLGIGMGHDEDEDEGMAENDSLKMFLRGILGLL